MLLLSVKNIRRSLLRVCWSHHFARTNKYLGSIYITFYCNYKLLLFNSSNSLWCRFWLLLYSSFYLKLMLGISRLLEKIKNALLKLLDFMIHHHLSLIRILNMSLKARDFIFPLFLKKTNLLMEIFLQSRTFLIVLLFDCFNCLHQALNLLKVQLPLCLQDVLLIFRLLLLFFS